MRMLRLADKSYQTMDAFGLGLAVLVALVVLFGAIDTNG